MKRFQINKEKISKIEKLIEIKNEKLLIRTLEDLHYADIAEIIEELTIPKATYLIKLLESDKTADALAEVDEDFREKWA